MIKHHRARRFTAMALALLMILSVTFSVVATDYEGHWASKNIDTAYELGIMLGDGQGNFRPDDSITRGEFSVILWRALGSPAPKGECPFSDVAPDAYYLSAVTALSEMGIVTGYGNGIFAPGNTLTREMAFVMLARAYGLKPQNPDTYKQFPDAGDISSWARDAVSAMSEAGYLMGDGTGANAGRLLTRAETATLLVRVCEGAAAEKTTAEKTPDGTPDKTDSDDTPPSQASKPGSSAGGGGGNTGGTTKYTVTFDSAGGSLVARQSVTRGGKVTEPTAPTREGYTFGGWYREADCKNAWNFSTDTVTAATTLYAKWTYMGADAVTSATVTPLRVVPGNSTVVALVGHELGKNTTIKVFSDAAKTREVSSDYLTISIGSGGLSLDGEYVRTFIIHTKENLPFGDNYEVVAYNNGVKQENGTGFIVQESYTAPEGATVYQSVGYTSENIPVTYGTSEFDALSQLRAEASVNPRGGGTSLHGVISWEFDEPYSPTAVGVHTVTGTIGLPSLSTDGSDKGWTVNNAPTQQTLTVTATIIVLPQATARTGIEWVSNDASAPPSTAFNMTDAQTWRQIRFRPSETITGTLTAYNAAGAAVGSYTVTALANIAWSKPEGIEDTSRTTIGGPPTFEPEYCLKVGEYTSYGTIVLPSGWSGNPTQMQVSINVTAAEPASTYTVSGMVYWDAISSATKAGTIAKVTGPLTVSLYAAADTSFETPLGSGTIGGGQNNWSSSPVSYTITTQVPNGNYVVRVVERANSYNAATASLTVTDAAVTNANLTLVTYTGTVDAVSHATVNPYNVVQGQSTVVFLTGDDIDETTIIKVLNSSNQVVADNLTIKAGAVFEAADDYGTCRGFTLTTAAELPTGTYTVELYHDDTKQAQQLSFVVVTSYTAPAGARVYGSNTYVDTVKTIPLGTTEYEALAMLPGNVSLFDKSYPNSASMHYGLAWAFDAYNADVPGEYTATGTIGLPSSGPNNDIGWSRTLPGTSPPVSGLAVQVTAKVYIMPDDVDDSKTTTVWARNLETLDDYIFSGRGSDWGSVIKRPSAAIEGTRTVYNSAGIQLTSFAVTAIANVTWTMPVGFNDTASDGKTMAAAGTYMADGEITLPSGWTGDPAPMQLKIVVPATEVTLSQPNYTAEDDDTDNINDLLTALWDDTDGVFSFAPVDGGNPAKLTVNLENLKGEMAASIEELLGDKGVPVAIVFKISGSNTVLAPNNGSGPGVSSDPNWEEQDDYNKAYIIWIDLDSIVPGTMKISITGNGGAEFKIEVIDS